VEYEYARGKITQINFFTDYVHERRRYRLREEYRKGHVGYTLFFGEREVDIGEVPQLAGLAPVDFDGDVLMAVPVQFYESPKYQGRGRSIYDVKEDAFDAFDEVISQWMDALRAGRVRVYVPSTMIPRDPKTGGTLPFEQFGAYYAATERPLQEGIRDEIDTVQPKIAFEAFLRTYMTTLDLCLQGLISPATLGIDVGKMSSADAQREKKDVTGTTRNQITAMLEKALADLVCTALQVFDITQGRAPGVYSPVVGFGEYGAPSFETRIDAVSKAAAAEIMSVEAQVTELWGGSKDKDWIAAEVERIKRERGVETVPGPPGVGDPL
jgi:hypothetical protein